MAITTATYTGNGSTVLYSFNFPYLEAADIKVKVNAVLQTTPANYTFANATTIQFVTAPANGAKIQIYRSTDIEDNQATFYPGSSIRAIDLNNNFDQSLYSLQEIGDRYLDKYNSPEFQDNLDMNGYRIIDLGTPINGTDASTKAYAEAYADTKLSLTGGTLTGNLLLQNRSDLRFGESNGNGTNWVAFQAPDDISSNVTWTLPAIDGVTNQVITTNGSGTLNWTSVNTIIDTLPGDTNPNLIYIDKPRDTVIFGASTELATNHRIIAEGTFSGFPGSIGIARGNNTPTTTEEIASLNFLTSLHESVGKIQVSRDGGTWTPTVGPALGSYPTSMAFYTTPTGTAFPVERLTIKSDGKVGINTNSPTEQLTVDGNIEVTGFLKFEGSVANAFETTLDVVNPTADRTITLPNVSGTVITTGDSGTITSAMIANGAIVDDDISATAEIQVSKLADGAPNQLLQTDAAGTGVEWASDITVPGTLNVTSAAVFSSTIQASAGQAILPSITTAGDLDTGIWFPAANTTAISTGGSERLRIDSSGRVGIGTASPGYTLDVNGAASFSGSIRSTSTGTFTVLPAGVSGSWTGSGFALQSEGSTAPIGFLQGTSERMRIDSSGRLLVGTSSALTNVARYGLYTTPTNQFQTNSTSNWNAGLSLINYSTTGYAPVLTFGLSGSNTAGTNALVANNNRMGVITFNGNDGTNFEEGARIEAFVDGTPGANDMPGRLVFSTTADGASSPTERMRIDSSGRVGIGSSSPSTSFVVTKDGVTGPTGITGTTTVSYLSNTAGNRGLGINYDDTNVTAGILPLGVNSQLCFYTPTVATYAERMRISSTGTTTLTSAASTAPFIANIGASEVARIDSSGRLLVGTSSARSNFLAGTSATPLQIEGGAGATASFSVTLVGANANPARQILAKSRGSIGGNTIVANNDSIGSVSFQGNDGTNFVEAATVIAAVDGTPGTNDMPGRLVFSTTADGASSPTEQLRITNDGVCGYNQAAPVSYAVAATLVVGDLKNGLIQYTGAAATLTLPTGTLTEGGFSGIYTNMTFEWSVINTGSGTCTIGNGTGHTVTGSSTIAAGASGRFASRRTAANTFISYRIS